MAPARKPDHRGEVLAAKTRAAGELASLADRPEVRARVVRVDAGRPLADVLLEVERGIWDVL